MSGAKTRPPFDLPVIERDDDRPVFVKLQLEIDSDGNVRSATVIQGSGYRQLDNAVRRGVMRFTFWPTLRDGQAVAVTQIVNYRVNWKEIAP